MYHKIDTIIPNELVRDDPGTGKEDLIDPFEVFEYLNPFLVVLQTRAFVLLDVRF
jgi:hypothetical protein